MGDVSSKPSSGSGGGGGGGGGGRNSSSSDDEEDWMQADKYACWEAAHGMDYDGFVIGVSHVEMPLQSQEYDTAANHGFTHEALVFEVLCTNSKRVKFTAELTYAGVLKRWGHHTKIFRVKSSKLVNLTMKEVLEKIKTPKRYNLVFYNCKTYAAEKFKEF